MNIDSGFFSKLLHDKDFLLVKENKITEFFFQGLAKQAFRFISNHVENNGEVPTVRVFKAKFPTFSLEKYNGEVDTEEPLIYWCNMLRTRVTHNTLAEGIKKTVDLLEEFETENAYSEIKKTISIIESEVVETSSFDITKDTEKRIELYKERSKTKGLSGIPTGFNTLDFLLKGICKDTLTTLIAQTGVGKTWMEIIIGANCMLHDYKVLHLVTEMSNTAMQDRYDAVLFAKCYNGVDYVKLTRGILPLDKERQYFQFLSEDLPKMQSLIVDVATSVLGVSALIDKHKPDIVFIDSAYLMEDDKNAKDDWLRVANITRGLKKLAKRTGVPIFINTQADQNTSKKTGPKLSDIKYTQAIGQDSDNVLCIYRDEVMIQDNEMCLTVLKNREGLLGKIVLHWDFKTMNFSEIYSETNSDENKEESVPQNDEELTDSGVNIDISEVKL